MEENMYRFGVDADIGSATEKLNRIIELMDTIDGLNKKSKNNYFQSSQKDIDTNVKSMQEMIKLSKELDRQLNSIKSSQASKGDFLGVDAINAQIKDLQKNLDQTKNKFQQTADSRANMSGIDRNIIKDQERFNTELQDEVKYLRDIKALRRDLSATERRVKSRASNYSSAGRLTHNQAEVMRGDMNTLSTAGAMKSDNELKIGELNKQIDIIDQEMAQLAKNTAMNNNERTNETASLKAMRKTLQDTVKEFQEFNSFLGGLGETVSQTKNKMNDTMVDPDQKSWQGQMASRAPSIAMAGIGAFMGVVGGLYAKGSTANASMREPSVSIGQRTGNSDFRAVRKQAQEMGLEKGINYKGLDMLDFQESVLGSMGYKDAESLSDSTKAMAEGGRAVPVDKEQLNQFMEGAMRDGSVSNAEQIKGMQQAFLGAIEQSGMVGREKEQLDALNSLNQQAFAGRNGSKSELDNLVALQSMLSEKGGKSLQGEKGAQALGSLNDGLRGVTDNPMLSLAFGRGTKFQGLDGKYDLRKQMEKGINDPDNLKTMFNFADSYMGEGASDNTKKEIFGSMAREMGAELTTDQIDGLYEATNKGKNLDQKTLDKAMKDANIKGSEQYDKNSKDYKDSKEGTADRSEAVAEKQASYLNDMGDLFRKVNSAMGGLPSLLYAFAGGLVASIGALATSAGMSGLSTLLKGKMGSLFGGGATASAGGGLLKSMGSAFKGGGGFMGGIKGAGRVLKDATLFKGSEIAGKAGGLFKGGTATLKNIFGSGAGTAGAEATAMGAKGASGLSKAGGFLGKAGGALGKVAPWLAVGSAVADIATSDDKVKATGKNAGMLGGMALGAKGGAVAGATIGSAIPVVGTAIGGAVGGIVGGLGGGFLGSKAGEGLIDAGRGAIDWTKEKVSGVTDAIKDGFSWGKDKITDGLKGAFNLGKDIIGAPFKLVGKVGGWAKDKVSSFFGGEVAEASEIQQSGLSAGKKKKGSKNAKQENKAQSEEEKDINNKKLQSEKTREKNIMDEGANLTYYDTLLNRVEQLLAKAKAQNGMFGSAGGSGGSDGGGDFSGETPEFSDWEDAVKKASDQLGANASNSEIQKILKLIQTESGGKEVIQNDWDVNAQNGNPSKGLLQYIQTTFDAYKVKGHGDINSGYDQILAFFNNSNWQKDLKAWEERMARGSTGWGPTGSKRFAMGGKVSSPTNALIGEVAGQEEYVINPKQPTAPRLLKEAMAKTRENFSMMGNLDGNLLTAMSGSGSGRASNEQTFNTTNDIKVTVTDSGSSEGARQVGARIGSAVQESLNSAVNFYSKELKRT